MIEIIYYTLVAVGAFAFLVMLLCFTFLFAKAWSYGYFRGKDLADHYSKRKNEDPDE